MSDELTPLHYHAAAVWFVTQVGTVEGWQKLSDEARRGIAQNLAPVVDAILSGLGVEVAS